MIASASQSILLDASSSFDRTNPHALLYFEWGCIDTTFPSLACPLQSNELSSESTQLIPSYSLISGHTYIWKVTVHSGLSFAYDTLHLVLSSISVPSISVSVSPPGQLYSSATILLSATSNENIAKWNWLSLDDKLNIQDLHITSTETSSILQIPPQSVMGETSIYISGITEDGRFGSHVKTLTITSTTNGYCSISPTDAMTISTNFTIFCSSWHDIHGGNSHDLTYQFSYFDENGIQVFLSPIDKKQSQEIYLPDQKSSSIHLYTSIYSNTNELQNSFDFTLHPITYLSATLSIDEISYRLQEAQWIAQNWPTFPHDNTTAIQQHKCTEPLCALNIVASFSSCPIYNSERPTEMPSVNDILDIFIPLFENPNINLNETYIGIYISILYDLGTRSDTEFHLLSSIGEMLLTISSSLPNLLHENNNHDVLSNQQDSFAWHLSILKTLDYWILHRFPDDSQTQDDLNSLRALIREIITSVQYSISSEKYLSCSDSSSITLSTTSIIISVSRGFIEDLQTSARISLSYKSATFIVPNFLQEEDQEEKTCFYWHRGVFSPQLYPQESDQCTQFITELSILSSNGLENIFIQFDEDLPLSISFPKNNDCSTSHRDFLCFTNEFFEDNLQWDTNVNNCPFDDDSTSKYKFSSFHLGDFTLAFVPKNSMVPSASSGTNDGDSSNVVLSSLSSSVSRNEDSSSNSLNPNLSSDEFGINRILFWFIIVICFIIGVGLTVTIFLAVSRVRKQAALHKKARIDEFAIEMDEFRISDSDDENSDAEDAALKAKKENDTITFRKATDNLLAPIKKLFSGDKNPNLMRDYEENDDNDLVSPDERPEEKTENTFSLTNEESNSIFDDPDEIELIPNPSKKEKKSENSRLVVESTDTLSEDETAE